MRTMRTKNNTVLHQIIQPALVCLMALVLNSSLIQRAGGQSFTFSGSMTTNRENHTATLLLNGMVLVAGGVTNADTGGVYLSSAELFDPDGGTWTASGSLTSARAYHTATLLPNGKVLVAGGWGGAAFLSSVELYDPGTGKWSLTNSMHTARGAHSATLLPDGRVLVAGGSLNGTSGLASAELYDPTTGAWTTTGPMTTARFGHWATLLPSGKVLIAGGGSGHHSGTPIPGAELYDPATGKWTPTGAPNTARSQAAATLLSNGKVLLVGGMLGITGSDGNDVNTNSAELYDPATGIWTTTGSLTTGSRHGHTVTLLSNGTVLMAGGEEDDGDVHSSAETYDPAAGVWTATGYLNTAREWQTATLLTNGEVLMAGGCGPGDGSPAVASSELYDSTIVPLEVTTASLPDGTSLAAYNQVLSASGGLPPYSWTNSSGVLPLGLTLAEGGLISGKPTTNGLFEFTVRATDARSAVATQPLTLEVVVPPNTNKPTLKITNPIKTGESWSNAVFWLSGTAKDNVQVSSVWYQLNNSGWNLASTTNSWTNWTASVTLIKPGSNTISAYALNSSGNPSLTNTVTIGYVLTAPLTVKVTPPGFGTVTPDYNGKSLDIGTRYSMTAKAGKGFGFLKWSGSLLTNNPTLSFVMAPNLTLTANFVDVTRPVAVILSPKVHQTLTSAAFTVTGKASDNVGVTRVYFQLNGAGWNPATTTNQWTSWAAEVTLSPGTNLVQAFAEDAAGNDSLTNSVSFVYKSSTPAH